MIKTHANHYKYRLQMSKIYDNWDRLVRATLLREELRLTGHRTPSDLSSASSSSSFNFNASSRRVSPITFPTLSVGEAFDYDQVLLATDYFSQSNLIRHGRSGELYDGVLENGTRVVVKKIDLSSPQRDLYCISELQMFGKASHSRLVPLIGHCLGNVFEKFLVYKSMSNKDLSNSLFRKIVSSDDHRLPSLDWITRLKIAIGGAEALCYLHHECVPPLVHRDIQASSILLDDHFEVRLGSLGEVCNQGMEGNENRSSNSMSQWLPKFKDSKEGTAGTSNNATCADDVYCFGTVLLELVTGKLGVSAAVSDINVREWMAKILPRISIYDRELVKLIVDPSLFIEEDLLMEIWAMAIIAKACVNPQPSKRPLMTYVLRALENPLKVVTEEESGNSAKRRMPGYG